MLASDFLTPLCIRVGAAEDEQKLTVKLLLTFLVLDSATLASVRSTSSKMMDCRDTHLALVAQPARRCADAARAALPCVTHLRSLSVVQSPPSQFEVPALPTLERVGLFHQVPFFQHSLKHIHTHTVSPHDQVAGTASSYKLKGRH